ncbi:MAG: 30S ribosome-binding factor RbfA [Gammaproteobacteria bacterium]
MKQLKSNEKSNRIARVEALLRRELGRGFLKFRDPRVGMVNISEIKVSPDIGLAKIYVTFLSTETNQDKAHEKEMVAVLNKASGFFRGILAENWTMKMMPKIIFQLDERSRENQRLDDLLQKVSEELACA